MFKKLHSMPRHKQHLFSLAFSVICMLAAVISADICYTWFTKNTSNITLIFIFFLIVVSCNTIGYLYGAACSIFTVLWFNYLYTYPFAALNFTITGYPTTFLSMGAIIILITTLSSHLAMRSELMAEKERLSAEAEMEKMRANLLRAVSHDLRTPLTGIIGNSTAYLENHAHLTDEEKLQIVENICEDSEWLINMVENLLSVTRISGENLTIHTSEESLEEVVSEALQRMKKRHPACRIHVQIPEEFILLPMDAVLIEQVTVNLLENALLHSGSTELIDFIVENRRDTVTFTVRDYGQGIPEQKIDHLFDGTPCTSSTADTRKGMGIGLVICKTIIDAHRGSITGQNHARGAEFTFALPKTKEERLPHEGRR